MLELGPVGDSEHPGTGLQKPPSACPVGDTVQAAVTTTPVPASLFALFYFLNA